MKSYFFFTKYLLLALLFLMCALPAVGQQTKRGRVARPTNPVNATAVVESEKITAEKARQPCTAKIADLPEVRGLRLGMTVSVVRECSTYSTDSNQELQEWMLQTIERIYKKGFEYRKAGIILSGLVPREKLTKRMFDDERFQQQHNLMKAVDEINQKFGKDTVRFGSVKTEGSWKMKQTRKSQSYTTNWNELLLVG